jgi:hypothetical protein
MPFVAVALCAPAAFAVNDLSSSSGPPAGVSSAVVTRAAIARASRDSARSSLPLRVSARAAIASVGEQMILEHTRAQVAYRDPARPHGEGPSELTAALTPTVPGTVARILPDGYAAAPIGAPAAIQQAIWAGNQLIGLPYSFGGGHGSFISSGYDCSGSVSYALHGGGLLSAPLDSSEFFGWGDDGPGRWITVYTSAGHAFVEIAGIRLDTSTAGDPGGLEGPRWRPLLYAHAGYVARHPAGY